MRTISIHAFVPALAILAVALGLTGCDSRSPPAAPAAPAAGAPGSANSQVVLYSSVDEAELMPLLSEFEAQTGIIVRLVTDTEATKTTALVRQLEVEKAHTQADVYWGNELFNTINLSEAGYFERYRPATAEDVPAAWRSADDLYTCVGIRARTLVVSTRPEHAGLVAGLDSLEDLASPALKGKIGISDPAFGTVSSHLAALSVLWGEERYRHFLSGLRANDVELLPGNSVVADEVAAGTLAAGMTDNDDVDTSRAAGGPVSGALPDQQDGGAGTLLIPGSVALLRGAPHSEAGKRLVDFLCSPAVEQALIDAHYLGYSVRKPVPVRAMQVDSTQCAHALKQAVETAETVLRSPE